MKRRMFARLFATAPIAAGVAGSQLEAQAGMDMKDYGLAATEKANPTPPGVDAFWKAKGQFYESRRYIRALNEARHDVQDYGYPLSIDCLKSVSKIHKHHMMVKRAFEQKQAERSLTEKLVEQFGVADWFARHSVDAAETGYNMF